MITDDTIKNDYVVLRGKSLQDYKLAVSKQNVDERYFVNIKNSPQLGIFDKDEI